MSVKEFTMTSLSADETLKLQKREAASNGATLNGNISNGRVQNGASQNGAGLNGASQNGAGLNGASQNGAGLNGASQNGAELHGADQKPLLVAPNGKAIEISMPVFQVLQWLIEHLAQGKPYGAVPADTLMNEYQAARYLGAASYSFVPSLFASGELPFVEQGSWKLVRLGDLFRYEERMHQKRLECLDKLIAFSQETDTL